MSIKQKKSKRKLNKSPPLGFGKNIGGSAMPDFETIFDSDFSVDKLEKQLNSNEVSLNKSDSLIIMSFALPITLIRKKDGSFETTESKSFIYPTIFKLRENFNVKY